MRSSSVGGVAISYPDEVVAIFGRNPIEIKEFSGTSVTMDVSSGGKTVKDERSPFANECFFDLSYYLQVLFAMNADVDMDYVNASKGLSATYSVTLTFHNGASSTGTFTFSVCGVWASALSFGNESLRMFTGYPFSVGVYSAGGYTAAGFTLGERGMYNIPIGAGQTVRVSDGTTTIQTIEVKESCGSGIYLRWIDRYGIFRYWLFRKGVVTTSVKDKGQVLRKNTGTDFGVRRTGKEVNQSVEICAPLVDDSTFDFLLGVAASPVVDMYSDGEWVSVNVDGGDIARERAELQDFIVSVELPQVIVQSL